MLQLAAKVFAGKRAKVTEVWETRGDRAYMLLRDLKILQNEVKTAYSQPRGAEIAVGARKMTEEA